MNERKKAQYICSNSYLYEKRNIAEDLLVQISYFIKNTKIEPGDWIGVDKLAKQLAKQKNVSRKVLRSVQSKFEKIQNKYQR